MDEGWRARDLGLLDALDGLPREPLDRTVWRVVRDGRDPLLRHPSAGRWDRGRFDVLYTSFDPDGVVAEISFHLSRLPVFPSGVEFTLNEIEVHLGSVLRFADLGDLESLGVDRSGYRGLLYERTQEIGDAAAFLGFDGIVAPSARWDCPNLVVFCDGLGPDDLVLKASSTIDWDVWRTEDGSV